MLTGGDNERLNGLLAKRLTRFQTVNALDENVAILALTNLDWQLFGRFHNFLGDLIDPPRIEFLTQSSRDVDIINFYGYGLKQNGFPSLSFLIGFRVWFRISQNRLHLPPHAKRIVVAIVLRFGGAVVSCFNSAFDPVIANEKFGNFGRIIFQISHIGPSLFL